MKKIRTMQFFFMLAALIFCGSCARSAALDTEFSTAIAETLNPFELAAKSEGLVVVYLSPECPLCKNYVPLLRKISAASEQSGLGFVGVVSGEFYPDSLVRRFMILNDLSFPILMDPDFRLAHGYSATTTPQAQLFSPEGKILYSGAIDNWAVSLRKKRIEADRFYLADAIKNHLEGLPINPNKTEPVGCLIE